MTTRVSYANYANAARDALQMTADEGEPFAVVEDFREGTIWVMNIDEAQAYCRQYDAEYLVPTGMITRPQVGKAPAPVPEEDDIMPGEFERPEVWA